MAEEFLSPIDMLLDENNTDNIKLFNEDNYVKTHFSSSTDEKLSIFRVDVIDYVIYE